MNLVVYEFLMIESKKKNLCAAMEDVSKMQMHTNDSSFLEKEQIALINQVEWRAKQH